MPINKKLVLAAAVVFASLANAGPVVVKRSGCLDCYSNCMQTGILDTACVHDCGQANSKSPSCAVIMPTKRSEPLEVVQGRDTTACQLCDTVCITDWGSLDQTCIDSCEQRRTANRCAVLERQVTLPQPVTPDPNCIDCDTVCTNMTSSSSYYDCLVGCESKNSAHCGHTPKRRVSSAV